MKESNEKKNKHKVDDKKHKKEEKEGKNIINNMYF